MRLFNVVPVLAPVVLVLALCATPALALQGFPGYVTLPRDIIPADAASITRENFAEVEFPLAAGKTVVQSGRHVRTQTRWRKADSRPAAQTWAQWLPALRKGGWVLQGSDGAATYTLKHSAGGLESWLKVALDDNNQPQLWLIEVAAARTDFTLPAPAAQPEKFGPRDDFPYLGRSEGAVLRGNGARDEPLEITGGDDAETQLAGNGYLVKSYSPPAALSKLEFESRYRAALEKAGWKVKPLPRGIKPGEGVVIAQYAAQGRNIWAVLERSADNGDAGIMMKVADLGALNYGAAFDRQCRLTLHGVNFYFRDAALRPESTPVLEKARDLLQQRAAVRITVAGHTDNTGNSNDNLKLSHARAEAVRQWLVDHGVAAGRLTSEGYGGGHPVSENNTAVGRALNRRVELVGTGCKK